MADPSAADRSLLANLTKLEINTIIKENLTARKLPDAANAILDVALTYAWELQDKGFDVAAWFAEPLLAQEVGRTPAERYESLRRLEGALGDRAKVLRSLLEAEADAASGQPRSFDDTCITLDARTFIALRWAAWIMDEHPKLSPANRVILGRVRKNSDQMKNLMLRLYGQPDFEKLYGASRDGLNRIGDEARMAARDALQLDAKDMTLLRKVWEIGVQEVVAQTVIDLDGDSITYVARRYSAPSWGHMLEVHRLGVNSAVGYWGNLMDAMRRFLTDLVSIAAGGSDTRR